VVTILALIGVAAVLFAAAVLATRDGAVLADAPRDAADVPLPDEPLQPEDVGRLRFSLAARGYRMSEVDLALERLARELADRDRRIALLEAAAEGNQAPPVVPPAPAAPVAPAPAPLSLDAPNPEPGPVDPIELGLTEASLDDLPRDVAGLPPADLGSELVAGEDPPPTERPPHPA
jgi:DivIVA domain-containing protein